MKENPTAPKRDRRRLNAFIGMVAIGASIGLLIYFGQVAVIYVLSTLSLIALLLSVDFSDLKKVGMEEKTFLPNEAEKEVGPETKIQKAEILT